MLKQVLGIDEDQPSYGRLVEALGIDSGGSLFESEQLDYKSELPHDTFEFAKDVTAFANRRGGILLFGIKDVDESAGRITHVELGGKTTSLNQKLNTATQPLVTGLSWLPVECPDKAGRGFLLLIIPPSALAPHAVSNKQRLAFFWRQGREIKLMQEGDIERAYRQRAAAGEESRGALSRARDWVTGERGALYVLAAPALTTGRVYGSPREAVERLRRVQRSPVVGLDSRSVLGDYVRSRIGRVVGTKERDTTGADERTRVSVLGSDGVAAVRYQLPGIERLRGSNKFWRTVTPESIHPRVNSYAYESMLLSGVTMLLVALREMYAEFGVSGGMLLEVGLRTEGGAMMFIDEAKDLPPVLDEDASFDFELNVADLHRAATLGRLISDVHEDVLAGFDVHHEAVADTRGVLCMRRMTPQPFMPDASLWEAKGVQVR